MRTAKKGCSVLHNQTRLRLRELDRRMPRGQICRLRRLEAGIQLEDAGDVP